MNVQILHFDSPLETRRLLDDLISTVFGFTFQDWYSRGHWNQDYICYSIIEDGRMLANASIFRMDLLVHGKKQTWLQLGAVATHPEHRGQGLSRRLMETIIELHPGMPMFLCANPGVLDFYPKFGFRRIFDHLPVLHQRIEASCAALQRLNVDDGKIGEYLSRRFGFSNILDCANAAPTQFFHLLFEYPNHIYEIPDLGVMLVAQRSDNLLRLVDIAAAQPVTFAEILPCLDFHGVDTIEFGFNPDWLGVDCLWTANNSADGIFVRGKFPLTSKFILPVMFLT